MDYKKIMGYGKKKKNITKSIEKPKKNKIIEGIISESEKFVGVQTMKDNPPFKTSKQIQNEADLGDVTIPASVKRYMGRFIDGIKGSNLNKIKRTAILFKIIKALGITPQELSQYMSKVKRGM
tara:strand:+ start:83 stop:451 length:369 start_codon:yes stop_codon:yes gene_type:complete